MQSHVRNGHFVTNPLASKSVTSRLSGKETDFRRNFAIRNCANVEIGNITQTVGTAPNYDSNDYSGYYQGFFSYQQVAEIDMHDCTAWERRANASTYGIELWWAVGMRLTQVGNSNPWQHLLLVGGSRHGLTNGNYTKHILYDHCTISRIDAHCGYYDLTVRDSKVGFGGLRLIGQGPLNVERTDAYDRSFIMLRGDYGSTWDGDAHIIDCTHHPLKTGTGQDPHSLVGVMTAYDDSAQTKVHDYGYELHHPNLYVRNFTVDDTYGTSWATIYGMTYGIVSNHLNGFEKDVMKDYWPDHVEIDGINFVGYEDTWGYEQHVHFPLKTYGAAWEKMKAKGYRISGVKYNGQPVSADLTQGVDWDGLKNEKGNTSVTLPCELLAGNPVQRKITIEDIGDEDIVIEYTGDEPDLAFTDSPTYYLGNEHWIVVPAYYVEHRKDESTGEYVHTAYFSNQEIKRRWNSLKTAYPDIVTSIVRVQIRSAALLQDRTKEKLTEGKTTLRHVKLLKTHEAHAHTWGGWEQTWAATCTVPGEEHRVCSVGGYVQVRSVEAIGHAWGEWEQTRAATCTEPGEEQRVCAHDAQHVETRLFPALGHEWGGWAVAQPCTDTEDGLLERTCSRCGETQQEVLPAGTLYFEYTGAGGAWTQGDENALAFTFKRSIDDSQTFSHFTGVKVDGVEVSASDYDAAAGSVVITLHPDYLATLTPGDHEMQVLFDDGNDPTVAFTVHARQDSSQTPPNSPVENGTSGGEAVHDSPAAARREAGSAQPTTTPAAGDPLDASKPLALALAAALATLACILARRVTEDFASFHLPFR